MAQTEGVSNGCIQNEFGAFRPDCRGGFKTYLYGKTRTYGTRSYTYCEAGLTRFERTYLKSWEAPG
jgi:hypothetical protein